MVMPSIFISDKGKDNLSLRELVEILYQEHPEESVIELTREYCLHSNSNDILKKGMEFLYMNGFYTDLETLIEKNHHSLNASTRKWALVYQHVLDRRLKKCLPHESLQRIKCIETNDPELKCLVEFFKVTTYYELNQFSRLGNFLDIQQELFAGVEDRLLLSFFKIRLNQILLTYHLTRNELIMARKYAFRVLNQTQNPRTMASMHIKLGLSYTFDTYLQGMYHLNEALKVAKQYGLEKVVKLVEQRNIPFLSAHFNQVGNISSPDPSEQAHIEIAKGNTQKAIELLHDLPLDSPFQLYYLGKAKQDKDLLLQSYNFFIERRSDYFFSKLPLTLLRKL
ncbi:AimR family lysis-lysogeny pheromone receptor [Oceanobacillus manasiensis]|uniref:AimR family lysis-lysogeny pheromone receptor n=1 Tax=Oceanobacillus manasiensis TaxID=586413 RepID=UPI0005A91C29|nr:AimR family lysis-lysogeny pheromone receptor [Oceanobacillus manasiensis]